MTHEPQKPAQRPAELVLAQWVADAQVGPAVHEMQDACARLLEREARKLLDDGLSVREAAEVLGISSSAVHRAGRGR